MFGPCLHAGAVVSVGCCYMHLSESHLEMQRANVRKLPSEQPSAETPDTDISYHDADIGPEGDEGVGYPMSEHGAHVGHQ